MNQYDAIVIGAGPSGVTAARDLRDRGRSVLILEARDRLGGRTWTRTLAGYDDVVVEMGGTYVHPDVQHSIRREIERYDQPLATGEGRLTGVGFYVGGELRRMPVPPEQLVAVERAIVALANAAQRIDANRALHDQLLSDFDVPIDEFFAPLRLPAETREFLYGVIAAVSQCDVREVSMLQWLFWIAGTGSPISASFAVADAKLENGTGALWAAMVDDSGADVELGADVASIVSEASSVSVSTHGGQSLSAGVCVVAVGCQVLNRIEFAPRLDGDRQALLEDAHVSRGYKSFLVVEHAEPDFIGFGGFGGARDPRISWLFEDRILADGRTLLVAWGSDGRIDASSREAQDALRKYMPEAVVTATDGHDWVGDPYARGLTHFRRPGEALTFSSVVGGAHAGNVFFAGADLTPGIWNGTIDGGIETGGLAAAMADQRLRDAA